MFNARLSPTLLATAAVSLAFAGSASADSIVYLKGGDVYLTTTDAARQFQVTSTGGYSTVSQADDGTILATTNAGNLRRLDQMGNVLSDIATPVTGANNGPFAFKGPYDADLSPNGQKAAYGFTYTGYTSTSGGTWVNDGNATGFTRAAATTSIAEDGFRQSREYDAPEWVDDQRVLVSNGPGYPSSPVAVVEAGSGGSRSWFTDPENPHPHDATLSRNWRMLAMTNGDRTQLHVYRDQDGLLTGGVNACFSYSQPEQVRFSSPTFNRDGTILVWADGNGLEIAPIGDSSTTCPEGVDSKKILPGASSPDWGPADVPTGRTAGPSKEGPQPGGSSKDGQQPSGQNDQSGGKVSPSAATLSLLAGKTKLGRALGSGLTVTANVPAAGEVKVTATVAGKPVGSGTAKAKSAGLVTVKVRFTAAARKRLATSRKTTVSLTASQGAARGTTSLTLRK
ncbi:MAG: hypothetical protein PGN13_02490 [Patulibacter minatonensis]